MLESSQQSFSRDNWCLTTLQTFLWADLSCKKISGSDKLDRAGAVRLPRTWWEPPQVPHGAQARLAQHGAAVHAGTFPCRFALPSVCCRRNVLLEQPGTIQPGKLGGWWQLWLHHDLGPGLRLCHGNAPWVSRH